MVSVILPVFNAQKTVKESIQSIIDQTYKDWELLVINDGSTDNTKSEVLSFRDSRIKYIENPENKKLIYTLNYGLELANGEYIARMDADDISLPTRFEKQVSYMNKHPECVVCGTLIQRFKDKKNIGKPIGVIGDDVRLKEYLFRDACFMHPTVLFRADVVKKNKLKYDINYLHAEDYKFWIDMSDYGEFHNLNEPLLKYRLSDGQISQINKSVQFQTSNRCRREYIKTKVKNEKFLNEIESGQISTGTLNQCKKINLKYHYLLEVLYLSMPTYGFKEIMYFFKSQDIFRISFQTTLAFFKRIIKGKNSLL